MVTKILLGFVVLAALAFCGLLAMLYVFQRNFIYPIPEVDRSVPDGFEAITYTTSDGLDLQAGYRAAQDGMPTLVFYHGNGIDWQTTYFTTQHLVPHGYGVLAAEYRGYGGNPGSPTEQGLYRDGRAALDWLLAQDVAPGDIVLVGNSLGSGVAIEMTQHVEARALILVAAFKSMTATASNAHPYAPVDWLLHDRFESIAKIGDVTMPILLVHGERDQLIPLSHAQELAAANDGAEIVVLPGLGHNMSGDAAAQMPQLEFLNALQN